MEPTMATRTSPSIPGTACRLIALALAGCLVVGPAVAALPKASTPEKPPDSVTPGGQASYGIKLGAFFTQQHREAARRYFAQHYAKGKECPPGMERGRTGCAPPVP